jgi:hypothetical protein
MGLYFWKPPLNFWRSMNVAISCGGWVEGWVGRGGAGGMLRAGPRPRGRAPAAMCGWRGSSVARAARWMPSAGARACGRRATTARQLPALARAAGQACGRRLTGHGWIGRWQLVWPAPQTQPVCDKKHNVPGPRRAAPSRARRRARRGPGGASSCQG